jgi:TM2 domain-containing membrane protein YozV
MIRLLIILILFSFNAAASPKEAAVILYCNEYNVVQVEQLSPPQAERFKKLIPFLKKHTAENKKITAMLLTVLLGPLGVHRLYLGTDAFVPIVYVATLGGGLGILPFIDLVVIGFSDDLTRFENNTKVFMWANKKDQQ